MDQKVLVAWLQMRDALKVYHFTTSRYGEHVAIDKLEANFSQHLDRYLEVYQGHFGKFQVDKLLNFSVPLLTVKKLESMVVDLVALHEQVTKEYGKPLNDLQTILDEVQADVHQFIYLATFR